MVILHIPDEEYSVKRQRKLKKLINRVVNFSSETYSIEKEDIKYVFLHEKITPERIKTDNEFLCRDKIKNEVLWIEDEIKKAITDDRIMIYLQPIYSNTKKRFVSAEVLARIKREDGSLLMPSTFIPIAEQSGLIRDLEDVIIRKTCEFIYKYDLRALGLDYVEVNLSVKNGEKTDFAKKCKTMIAEYRIDPSLVNFEITETAVLSEKSRLLENMNQMIEHGFRFSLDDFGSGESNLNYIIDMPITIIKFDKTLTDAYKCNDKAKAVIKSVICMAHDMGIKIVSEGVETEDTFCNMNDIGIDYIQGFYFSKPLPVLEFVSFIEDFNKKDPL